MSPRYPTNYLSAPYCCEIQVLEKLYSEYLESAKLNIVAHRFGALLAMYVVFESLHSIMLGKKYGTFPLHPRLENVWGSLTLRPTKGWEANKILMIFYFRLFYHTLMPYAEQVRISHYEGLP